MLSLAQVAHTPEAPLDPVLSWLHLFCPFRGNSGDSGSFSLLLPSIKFCEERVGVGPNNAMSVYGCTQSGPEVYPLAMGANAGEEDWRKYMYMVSAM